MNALVIVDPQNDFINGSLAVPGAEKAINNTIEFIKEHKEDLAYIAITADWHPYDHCSFKEYGGTWESHCVMYSAGASIYQPLLEVIKETGIFCKVWNKGTYSDREEYSIFDREEGREFLDELNDRTTIDASKEEYGEIYVAGLAGYGNGEDGPTDWMYQQVLEAIAVFSSHSNSGMSAPWEIDFVKRLCSWDVISPLRFTDDEWQQISPLGVYQNKRKSNVFKEPNGDICYNGAFTKRPTGRYSSETKQWSEDKNPICWSGGLFEHKNNVLTGRYFSTCLLRDVDKNRWIPEPTRTIDCVEVEIAPGDWIMAVDADNTDLFLLSRDYNIVWKQCPCLEGVRLEDVTPELSDLAYNEVKNS